MNGPNPRDEVRLNDGPDGTAAVRPPNAFRATTYNLCRGPAATAVRSYGDHTPGPGCVTVAPVVRISPGSAAAAVCCLFATFRPGPSPLSARVDPTTDERRYRPHVVSPKNACPGCAEAALANEFGKLVADFTGRGATRSRAFVEQDVVVCVLEDGATRAERNLVAAGKSDLVRVQRDALQRAMGPQLIAAVDA